MEPKFFDIHCHLNVPEFDLDKEEVLSRTLTGGCWLTNVGVDLVTSRVAVKIAQQREVGAWATVGCHPTDSGSVSDTDWEEMCSLAEDLKVIAIGECGLEYYSHGDEEISEDVREQQKIIFRKHIDLALALNKPLMIHCRPSKGSQDAYEDATLILGEYKKEWGDKLRGDFHFFAGDWIIAQKCLELGFYLSFTGVITFARDYDEVIQKMPLNRLLAETDAPYVAPVPYRGKRCEPLYVSLVVKKMAELRNVPELEIGEIIIKNARRLFSV